MEVPNSGIRFRPWYLGGFRFLIEGRGNALLHTLTVRESILAFRHVWSWLDVLLHKKFKKFKR